MKILEGNNYCRCSRCHSFLRYAPEDINSHIDKQLFGLAKSRYDVVVCPVCKTEIPL